MKDTPSTKHSINIVKFLNMIIMIILHYYRLLLLNFFDNTLSIKLINIRHQQLSNALA